MVEGARYQRLAEGNRFRLISVDAPRGILYDRQGNILVRNEARFVIQLVPERLPREREGEVLAELAELLAPRSSAGGEGQEALAEVLEEGRRNPQVPLTIVDDVPRSTALIIQERLLSLPGVIVKAVPGRRYLYGPLLSHILGYVGSIPGEQLQEYLSVEGEDYDQNDIVGRAGLERAYEGYLRGDKGRELVEVDANEQKLRVLGVETSQPGNGLVLTLDLELQRATEAALRRGIEEAGSQSGVAIAMDPRNGDILAMVSLPGYDANLFAGGIEPEELEKLLSDPQKPLLNHAIGGLYPPGSTIKPLVAVAALEEGVLDSQTHLSCAGILHVPHRYFPSDPSKAQPFYCWRRSGHGSLDLEGAISQSCDIFFYQVGGGYQEFEGLGLERMAHWLRSFGWGEDTGIALSGEAGGLVPSAEWKETTYAEPWFLGDTYNAAIGQGFVLVTPLQLLNAVSAIANGGSLFQPRLVQEVQDPEGGLLLEVHPRIVSQLEISAENLELVRQGMHAAVARGTARRAGLPSVEVAGKTGTAEYPGPRDDQGNLPTHAWFVAFAPLEDPEIAVLVFVEGGGEGSAVAAPISAEIMRNYFGLPQEESGGER
jgi:penicillin-binding protein 2